MKRDFSRSDRVANAIQKTLATIIHQQMQDPRVGMLTLEAVQLSKDLAYAKIFVSFLNPDEAPQTLKALNQAEGFLRNALGEQLKMRIVPHLRFIFDETTLKADRLNKLIDAACKQEKKQDDSEEQ